MGGRRITVLGAAALMVGVLAAPASAHVWFDGDRWAPEYSDQKLTLNMEEEEGPAVHNAGVVAKLPTDWKAVSCATVAGWKCAVEASPPVVRWTRNAGASDVARETFTFTAHTGYADNVHVSVVQTYVGGKVVEWNDDKYGDCPAARFKVVRAKYASPAPSPTPSPSVLGIQIPRAPQVLPRTGTNAALPAAIGAVLIALGSGVLLVARRRRKPAA